MKNAVYLALCVLIAPLSACGGSASGGGAPTTPTSTSTTLTITGISPSPATVSTSTQTVTISGTNFQSGLTLTVTPPTPPASAPLTLGPLQPSSATTLQATLMLSLVGTYTFQIQNPAGERSNVASLNTQFRTAGATWIPEGVRLTTADVGFAGAFADTSSIQLRDGRWRMFLFAGDAIRSAVSPDGLRFSMESGSRLPQGLGMPRVMRLDDGRFRIYFITQGGIGSAISGDEGVTFTVESGMRITGSAVGVSRLSGAGIARVRDGRLRMYFSDLPAPGSPVPHQIFSATSSDGLSWNPDAGVRIGAGATLSGSGQHPSAISNSDGSVSIFYGRTIPSIGTMWSATSADGLTFTSETPLETLGRGDDADVVRVGGSLRMYYNWGDDNSGTVYSAFNASGAFALTPFFTRSAAPRSWPTAARIYSRVDVGGGAQGERVHRDTGQPLVLPVVR